MYVTRRLLRSTIISEPPVEKKDVPFLSPATLKRRAAVRASAKISDVVTDVSGPAARSRAAKSSRQKMEMEGDETSKRRHLTKGNKEKETKLTKENEHVVDVAALYGHQLMVDVHYRGEQYTEARILKLDPKNELVFVHYMGWNTRFDAWVEMTEVAAHGSHCEVAKKKDVSWDGITSLFALKDDVAAHRRRAKTKPKRTPKKGTARSALTRRTARTAPLSASWCRRKLREEVESSADEELHSVLRPGRTSPNLEKEAKKPPRKSPQSVKKDASSSSRRTPRRVQVAVGTIDEDSERANESETVDLVLDVEVETVPIDSITEAEDRRTPTDEGKRKARDGHSVEREKSSGAKRTRDVGGDVDVVTCDAPHPRKKVTQDFDSRGLARKMSSPSHRGGLGSATRAKLAAIFRLRVQQRQQLEQRKASDTSFQQSLLDPAVDPLTDDTSTSASETDVSTLTIASAELAAAEEYQRQLQQYYYQQQVALVTNLNAGSEDPSTFPLQGGVMDPRIIQERLTALEERRRQQAHVQAYYHQLMVTRERNVRALAANQAFMATSAAVWEHQVKETQSEDGTSSVSSWKDVTSDSKSTSEKAGERSDTEESSRGDDNESTKGSESSARDPKSSSHEKASSPTAVEKADGSSPTTSVPDKSDPPLYEFVL